MASSLVFFPQDEDVVAAPFGTFMEAVPHWAFIIIHSTLILVALWLASRVRRAGSGGGLAANGFLLFCLAEAAYITYHLGATHFLFAHTLAEVLDGLAFVVIAVAVTRRG